MMKMIFSAFQPPNCELKKHHQDKIWLGAQMVEQWHSVRARWVQILGWT